MTKMHTSLFTNLTRGEEICRDRKKKSVIPYNFLFNKIHDRNDWVWACHSTYHQLISKNSIQIYSIHPNVALNSVNMNADLINKLAFMTPKVVKHSVCWCACSFPSPLCMCGKFECLITIFCIFRPVDFETGCSISIDTHRQTIRLNLNAYHFKGYGFSTG